MQILSKELRDRIAARTSRYAHPANAFVAQPEPKSIGMPNRGTQLIAGNFLFAGELLEAPGTSIWQLDVPSSEFEEELHGFGWLDHLAAEGSKVACRTSQDWVWDWIARYGDGTGPGWKAHLTGRRVVRWINHALLLLRGQPAETSKLYFKSLGHQASFLQKRWMSADEGLPRFEALIGLIYCGLALETKRKILDNAMWYLGAECEEGILADGSIQSRNPEELMKIFTLLSWAAQSLSDAGHVPHREHLLAMERIVPTLRALRLGDGSLIHFHGGGRGTEGMLDQSLADASIRLDAYPLGGMGYSRLSQSGTTVLMDTGDQPQTELAHNSPLAFEMSSGRVPIIVNIGPGSVYGSEWHRVASQMVAHSGVAVLGKSPLRNKLGAKELDVAPPVVSHSENEEFQMLVGRHNGYVNSHGLEHFRSLELSRDGRTLRGRDRFLADTANARRVFDAWMESTGKHSMALDAHFHINPAIEVELGLNGRAVTLALPNGESWMFKCKLAKIEVKPSAYVEIGRLRMRGTKQIVASFDATNYEGVIQWSLTKS